MHRLLVVTGQGKHTVLFYKRGYGALGLAHCIPGNQNEVRGLIWTGVPSSEFYWARFRARKEAAVRSRVAPLWHLTGK